MSKRSFSIFLLTAAFLTSAWGNVLAASFCPRYSINNGLVSQKAEQKSEPKSESCHHEMAQMDNEGGPETELATIPTAEDVNPDLATLRSPNQPCGHCWTHSQLSSGSSTVAAPSPSRQSVEANVPPSRFVAKHTVNFALPITPFEHGPPGASNARYLLINIFRI